MKVIKERINDLFISICNKVSEHKKNTQRVTQAKLATVVT